MKEITNENPHMIILHRAYFNEVSYRLLEPIGIPREEMKQGELKIKIGRSCIGLGDDEFIVTFEMIGYQEGAYNFKVVCSGDFYVPDKDPIIQKDILSTSCLAILFPFVREKVMHLVNNDGIYHLVIQPFYVEKEFKDAPPMEIVYIEKPKETDSDDPVSDFLSSLDEDPDESKHEEPEVRAELVQLLHGVKDHIWKRNLDRSIVISQEGYKEFSTKVYQYLKDTGHISSVDDKISGGMMGVIFHGVNIPIDFVLFNDSENGYKPAYAIIKKSNEEAKN